MARSVCKKPPWAIDEKPAGYQSSKTETGVSTKLFAKLRELVRRETWAKDDQDHRVDWTDAGVWDKIKTEGCYHRADEVLISCGTVTIHQAQSTRPKVLVVHNSSIGIFQLPKGRKDFGEDYLEAALRETTEETGIAVRPLRLKFGSRSTPPKLTCGHGRETKYGIENRSTGITEGLHNETVGVNPDPATGAWRNIHWYAAQPCDEIERNESRMTEDGDRKKFTTFWFSEQEALTRLKLDDEKYMIQVTFAHVRGMLPSDWDCGRTEEEHRDHL